MLQATGLSFPVDCTVAGPELTGQLKTRFEPASLMVSAAGVVGIPESVIGFEKLLVCTWPRR